MIDNAALASDPAFDGLKAYWKKHSRSIDGLPGVQTGFNSTRRFEEYPTPPFSTAIATANSPTNLKAEQSGPSTKAMLMMTLAFGAGVVLSAQVQNIVGHIGSHLP